VKVCADGDERASPRGVTDIFVLLLFCHADRQPAGRPPTRALTRVGLSHIIRVPIAMNLVLGVAN